MYQGNGRPDKTRRTGRRRREPIAVRGRLRCWPGTIVVGVLAGLGLPAAASATGPAPAPAFSSSRVGALAPVAALPHGMGLPVTQAAAVSAAKATAIRATAAVLPVSVDLTPFAAPVGDQGQVGSCAAWATDYTALGYWENKEGIAGGVLAPMYTYSQLVNGQNVGTYIDSHLVIAEQQGVDNQATYPQGNYDYIHTPTVAERANAAKWKLTSFNDLAVRASANSTVTQQSIEAALAAGTPVVIGIPVYANFDYVTSANHGFYAGASGSFLGGHAITALGYNSTGLRIENSWGTGWGDNGFATLSWSFINSDLFQAVAVGPLVASGPADTVAPVIGGTDRQGQTLTAGSGTWSPTATTYAYQWQRSTNAGGTWAAINGATGSTYLLAGADIGASVRILVTATNLNGQGTATSAGSGPVLSGAPALTGAPVLGGVPARGSALTVSPGTWSPAAVSYAYQWQRSANRGATWADITGATAPSYAPSTVDETAQVRVLVTGINAYGTVTAASAATAAVAASPPVNTGPPTVSGVARRGGTLTASVGTWTGVGNTYAYQWQRHPGSGFVSIAGATAAAYAPTQADLATAVRVLVTAVNPDGTVAAASLATAPVGSAGH